MALEPIAPNLWTASMPHTFMGLQLGTRMTVVRLSDGSLFVHSPITLNDELKREIDSFGPVAHIVAPSLYHHLFIGEFAAAYPEAKTHAAPGLDKKRSDLTFHATLGEKLEPSWRDDLSAMEFEGCALGETVFFHHPSRTLISADFIQNFDTSEHWPTRWYLKAAGIHGKASVSRLIRMTIRDKAKARRAVDRVIEWNPARITLAHGQPILADGQQAVRSAYSWLTG